MRAATSRVDLVDGSACKHQGGLTRRNCGILHGKGLCPAAAQQYYKCKRLNHFARMSRMPGGHKTQVNTVDDHDSYTESMVIINSRYQDWVETVDFGSVKEMFKLNTGAQNVLPKTVYENNLVLNSVLFNCGHIRRWDQFYILHDKITTVSFLPSLARLESYSKTCIKPVGRCELTC